MPHHVPLHTRSLDKDDLATGRVALFVLDARQRLGRDAGAVDDDPRGGTGVGGLDGGKPVPDKVHAVLVLEPAEEVLDVLGRVEGEGGEGDAELDAGGELVARDFLELAAFCERAVMRGNELGM